MDKAESFVFYRSFAETAHLVENEEDRLELYEALITYGLTGEKPPLHYPLNAILEQMTASVKAAADRYAAAKENGEKGGRPTKRDFIPPAEWQEYLKTHSQEETASHFGITARTLRNWISAAKSEAEKTGKNLNNNINDNLNLNVNSNSNSNYKKNNINNNGGTPSAPQSGSAPRPMMPGYEFTHNGKNWRINDRGEAEVIGTAE